jgi:hypothetical protein
VNDRIVLALPASNYYGLRGVHVGTGLATFARRLRFGTRFRIGLNWCTAAQRPKPRRDQGPRRDH